MKTIKTLALVIALMIGALTTSPLDARQSKRSDNSGSRHYNPKYTDENADGLNDNIGWRRSGASGYRAGLNNWNHPIHHQNRSKSYSNAWVRTDYWGTDSFGSAHYGSCTGWGMMNGWMQMNGYGHTNNSHRMW